MKDCSIMPYTESGITLDVSGLEYFCFENCFFGGSFSISTEKLPPKKDIGIYRVLISEKWI